MPRPRTADVGQPWLSKDETQSGCFKRRHVPKSFARQSMQHREQNAHMTHTTQYAKARCSQWLWHKPSQAGHPRFPHGSACICPSQSVAEWLAEFGMSRFQARTAKNKYGKRNNVNFDNIRQSTKLPEALNILGIVLSPGEVGAAFGRSAFVPAELLCCDG